MIQQFLKASLISDKNSKKKLNFEITNTIATVIILTSSIIFVVLHHVRFIEKVSQLFGCAYFIVIHATNDSSAESNETNDDGDDNKQEFHFDFVIAPIK